MELEGPLRQQHLILQERVTVAGWETDGLGNAYRLVRTIDSTNWHAIKAMFKELFSKHYGNHEGQVLCGMSSHLLNGDDIYDFSEGWVTRQKVRVRGDGITEFWELVGKGRSIFDHMKDEKERKELVAELTASLSLEELRRARLTLGD